MKRVFGLTVGLLIGVMIGLGFGRYGSHFKATPFLMTIPCAVLLLLIGTGVFRRAAGLATWSKMVCIANSTLLVLYGYFNYLEKFDRSLSEPARLSINHSILIVGNLFLGSFFTLVCSGELAKLLRKTTVPPSPSPKP